MDLQDRILDKLDKIDDKLDGFGERIAKGEERQSSTSGQIKLLFALILAGATSTFGAVMNYFFK